MFLGLVYSISATITLHVEAYSDFNFADSHGDGKSTSSFYTYVGWNLVTERGHKQYVVALSSVKAENRAMA